MCWAGVVCGCDLSVEEFQNYLSGRSVLEFDYFKKFQVLIFKIPSSCQSCPEMRFGGKKFLKLWLFPPEDFKTCCSHQKVDCDITPIKSIFENGGLLTN
jgi:hypothetical protein